MSAAIVTITCPWCGGHVEGLRATNIDQTVKCPYCRTELHVPRVGEVVHERVIRELIREVPQELEPDLNCMPSRRNNPVPIILATVIGLIAMLAIMSSQGHDHMIEEFQAQDRAEDACRQRCDDTCASAGDKESGKELYLADTEQLVKDSDVMICTVDCQRDHGCIGLSPRERERLR